MKKSIVSLLFTFLLYAWAGECLLANPSDQNAPQVKTPFRIPFVTGKMKVDGIMDEAFWQNALKLTLDYEVNPGENIPAPVKTDVYLAYNESTLYIGFKAHDPQPGEIRAHWYPHDDIYEDDWVGVAIDATNDQRSMYEFFCNPFGNQGEVIELWDGQVYPEWDAIWDSAGKINKDGYCVEMAIPFSQMRFPKSDKGLLWGIDLVRMYPRSSRHQLGLFKRDRNNICFCCQMEKLIGFENIHSGHNIELDPTLTANYTQERENPSSGEFHKLASTIDAGLTARWSLTSNSTLNVSVNPDFSNVEADAAQVTINQMFPFGFPEKRPFFLEALENFNTRLMAIYTRSLVEPDWGVKFTGKIGDGIIGFFSVQDHATNLIFPYNQGTDTALLNQTVQGTALRYRLNVGPTSTIGCMVTDREGSEYFNRVVGIDFDLKLSRKDRLRMQYLGSDTRYPAEVAQDHMQTENSFWGNAYDLIYTHASRNWDWFLYYRDITASFRADLGFMPQADFRILEGSISRKWLGEPNNWFTNISTTMKGWVERDHDNLPLEKGLALSLKYQGPMLSFANFSFNLVEMTYWYKDFHNSTINFHGGFRSGTLAFNLTSVYGYAVDFDNVQQGNIFNINPQVEFLLGTHLNISLEHIYEHFTVPGGRLYDANISKIKFIYNFDRRMNIHFFLQNVNYDLEPANWLMYKKILPTYKYFFPQILFTYKINPQTVLFLGYNQDYQGNLPVWLLQTIKPTRSFFFKIGYALPL